jgi:ABC-type dipeptide/oligopeptide/nickel transport system permease component
MGKYIMRRLWLMAPALLGVSLVVFAILRLLPGDPAMAMLGVDASPSELVRMRGLLGLDRPLYEQYIRFVSDILRGDFGKSIVRGTPALQTVLDTLPATIELALSAMLVSMAIAIPLGILAAGMLMILLFSLNLHWFSPFGRGEPIIDALGTLLRSGDPTDLLGSLKHIIMPALALGANVTGLMARITRSSMLEVLRQDYVRTAKAKGLMDRVVVMRHALRNSLLPITTVLGLQFGALLGGAVITETVFAWPGVGRLVVQAINQRDFPVVQATVIVMAVSVLFLNLIVDISYAYINPRIRYS